MLRRELNLEQNYQRTVDFSLEETVWFKKGQEVKSIRTLSLEPDVHIEEQNNYISLSGYLQLSGEYEPAINEVAFEDTLREISPLRTIEDITPNENGVWSLYHRFPVDITIPKSKVRTLEDITIKINMFDYDLPTLDRIEIKADVSICGICQEAETPQPNEAVAVQAYEDLNQEDDFDVYKVRDPQIYAALDVDNFSPVEVREFADLDSNQFNNQVETPKPVEMREYPYFDQFEQPQPANANQFVEYTEVPVANLMPNYKENQAEVDVEDNVTTKSRAEDALYLTKFLCDKENAQSRVKLYFVQYGDSVVSIASRFNVPVQQINRVNNIDDDNLSEGQLLYIPLQKQK
ncbi:MAG: spoVID [Bacillales bacterium]|nr:spoVID [Bacillales bacterium]